MPNSMGEAGRSDAGTRDRLSRAVVLSLALACFVFVLRCAWVCDDAYITMRAVDNLVHGFGPTWNAGERVQVFTHPAWMGVLSAVYFVLRDPYVTLLAASLATTLLFLVLFVRWFALDGPGGVLAMIVLAGSKSFVDFSTSGLENPLSHLLLLWACKVLWDGAGDARQLAKLSLVASLGALNRVDSLLLFLPLLAPAALAGLRARGVRAVAASVGTGFLSLAIWEAFSLFYYGSLVPNTAYAKLGTGLGLFDYAARGGWYFLCTLAADPITILALLGALALAPRCAASPRWPVMVSILLGLAYSFRIGGDFMLGRLYTGPLVLACCCLARTSLSRVTMLASVALLAAAAILPPLAPWRSGPDYDRSRAAGLGDLRPTHGVQDERGAYFPYTGLLRARTDFTNAHPALAHGRLARERAELGSGETTFAATIGMSSFHAGPRVRVYDVFGLADPLLARLPMQDDLDWKPGHCLRRLPAGYSATRKSGEDRLEDPDLAAFYETLQTAITGDLWSARRFAAIGRLHLGETRERFRAYCERYRRREVALDP
jgi:arabinofuranosyltransferase